jgi:thymidylate kinase
MSIRTDPIILFFEEENERLRAEVERLQAESEAFRSKLAEQCGQTLVARAEVERASTAYMFATNRAQHYEAEVERLKAELALERHRLAISEEALRRALEVKP